MNIQKEKKPDILNNKKLTKPQSAGKSNKKVVSAPQKEENILFIVYTRSIGHVLVEANSSQSARQKVAMGVKEGFKGIEKVVKLSQNTKIYFKDLLKRIKQQIVVSA